MMLFATKGHNGWLTRENTPWAIGGLVALMVGAALWLPLVLIAVGYRTAEEWKKA